MHRPPLPQEKSLVLTFRGWADLRAHGAVGGTTEKIHSDTTGNRSRDHPNIFLYSYIYEYYIYTHVYIQGVSRLVDITAGGDFLGLCDQKSSYKHVSDFGRLRSYGQFLFPTRPRVNRVLRNQLAGDVLNLVAYRLRCKHYVCHVNRAVHNRTAACFAAVGGIFENQL